MESPDNPAAPAEPVEGQTPPPEYEPQTGLSPDQSPGITERDGVTVEATEEELSDSNPKDGDADGGDDDAEDDDNDDEK